jgi:hypothetical protein
MEQQHNIEIKERRKRFGLRRKPYIFFICFLLSSLIWLLIKLSKEYSETAVFPVTFSNFPSDKVLVNDLDSTLTLQLKTKGFKRLSNMLFHNPKPINVSVGPLLKKMKNSKTDYYILTSELYQLIGSQIHYPNNIFAIDPDTLHFILEKKFTKKVPVRTKLDLSFAQQYELADSISFNPDSVIVSGPKAVMDTLKYIETSSMSLSNISTDQHFSTDFAGKYKKAKLIITPALISVTIPVGKYTEAWVDLTISISNNPNNYIVRTFPEKTRITYVVSLKNFKDVKPDMFSAVADLSKALDAKSKKLKVEIEKYPAYVKIRKIDPDKIEYILLK